MTPTATETTATTTQVYRVYIKASPQAIWDAITSPEWSDRYGYGGHVSFDLRPQGAFSIRSSEAMKKAAADMGFETPDVIVDGEVIETDPPHKLVLAWRMLMDPQGPEAPTRLTYEIEEGRGGVSKLTVVHDVTGAPRLALAVAGEMGEEAGGGWSWVLSDLKSLLETGRRMASNDETS